MERLFYLAGPYNDSTRLNSVRRQIEQRSGWQCTSRWLENNGTRHASMDADKSAMEDLEDIVRASILIIDEKRQSTKGGMYIEFGFALAIGKPIVTIRHDRSPSELSVFQHLSDYVMIVDNVGEAGAALGLYSALTSGERRQAATDLVQRLWNTSRMRGSRQDMPATERPSDVNVS